MKTTYEVRQAAHPEDVKHYDTQRLRKEHLISPIFVGNEVTMVYTLYDRLIVGGAMPVDEKLSLEAIDPLKMPFFLSRRELGVINVGGKGRIIVEGIAYDMDYKEALYIGMGDRNVVFESINSTQPAKFYFNSAPAHTNYPDKKITKSDAVVVEMGSMEEANHRVINKLIVNQVLPTCQLQMGMTELKTGSVWNTMPAHIHSRRMEAYFYFEVPENNAVCHFMGEPTETRHIWMQNEEAVISPSWSVHSGTATSNYTFIWGMGGENLDYGDQDFCKTTDLR
ncbi:5-dehydro-4-deoxy-D-glucuronate isomerase [Microbacter margulisiae]|uniref:4-deoxy-L-threo-5-hexosulose-uronate ketol-isomerase n=1 Tax=Microbacter margulisiae TaxID=1350067 RepID=A0A7W5H186_9PORP|nr:5-dehydro-4-deoxy-D-glucuronate isomerase [Microbacter margulisiae]MBB3187323.1 4-deoxy-L-threo-5-hexosulose-uronate ketol-isomerase [Microbacter margulisiae]